MPARENTILIADDFSIFRRFIHSTLKENGFQNVAEASDGVEAVAKAAHQHPDLVLLDIRMPNLDGIKAAAQIRTRSPKSKILFLSIFTDPDIVQLAVSEGAAGYVPKSEMHRELLPAIEAALEGGGVRGRTIPAPYAIGRLE